MSSGIDAFSQKIWKLERKSYDNFSTHNGKLRLFRLSFLKQVAITGQGVQDYLIKKGTERKEKIEAWAQWENIDAQLCSLLGQSIDSISMALFRSFQTCYSIWEKVCT